MPFHHTDILRLGDKQRQSGTDIKDLDRHNMAQKKTQKALKLLLVKYFLGLVYGGEREIRTLRYHNINQILKI